MFQSDKSFSANSFVLSRADLVSYYLSPRILDIRNMIVDIDLFETVNKPYLTGDLIMQDDTSLYSIINFRGIEVITLGFRLPEDASVEIKKTFYIDKIIRTQRANDQQTVIMLHLTEDVGFISDFINVNKAYQGNGSEIIRTIFRDFFSKTVDIDEKTKDVQPPFKIVVPNVTPLTAVDWVKDRITADNGAPYYLYSTLVDRNIQLRNWQTMVLEQAYVPATFVYSQSQTNNTTLSIDQQMFTIENFQDGETSDLSMLNDNGFVNAKYFFHDVNTNTTYSAGHSIPTESYNAIQTIPFGKKWSAKGLFEFRYLENRPEQTVFQKIDNIYPAPARLPWSVNTNVTSEGSDNPLLHNRPESRVISQIYSSKTFGSINNYNEADTDDAHLLKVDAKASRNWIMGSPISITVPGRLFLNGKSSATLGRKYKLQFSTFINGQLAIDARRTGDYIVFAARHMFSRDAGYKVVLTCVGLQNRSASDVDILVDVPTPLRSTNGSGPQ